MLVFQMGSVCQHEIENEQEDGAGWLCQPVPAGRAPVPLKTNEWSYIEAGALFPNQEGIA